MEASILMSGNANTVKGSGIRCKGRLATSIITANHNQAGFRSQGSRYTPSHRKRSNGTHLRLLSFLVLEAGDQTAEVAYPPNHLLTLDAHVLGRQPPAQIFDPQPCLFSLAGVAVHPRPSRTQLGFFGRPELEAWVPFC